MVPDFVRRAAWRVLAGGAVGVLVVALVAVVGERIRFGGSNAATRERIAADVQRQFSVLAARLDAAVTRVRGEPVLTRAVATRDATATRELFDRLANVEGILHLNADALTVYGPQGRPLAWAGRPGQLPAERLTADDALFLAPSSTGLRLTRVTAVMDPSTPDRRVATLVAEAPLPRAADTVRPNDFSVTTSIVSVPLRLTFEADAPSAPGGIVILGPDGQPLARVDVPAEQVDLARSGWRTAALGAELLVFCAVLLLLIGPLLDWRRSSRSIGLHIALTATIIALLLVARSLAWLGVRLSDISGPPLVLPQSAGPLILALATPADFIFTALMLGALVALAASSFEQWRHGRRGRVRVLPDSGLSELIAFVVTQAVAGGITGLLLLGYAEFLRTRLTLIPIDILHFSLHPVDAARLAVAIGLVVIHAALLALIVLLFRVAMTRWVIAGDHRWIRVWIPVLWAVPAIAVFVAGTRGWEPRPLLPSALVVLVAIAAAWRLRRYRAVLEHASQAARLTALFVAFALPSIVFYPSLVDAAGRARRQLIEGRYAPEVSNQRRNLQLQLNQAMREVDALPDLAELVEAGSPTSTLPTAAPTPYETAFRVWERTSLEDRRLTSSVELHDATGALVSRFSLKLPQTGGPQTYQELCEWQVFEEVSPFFSEERRLLHAGKGICVDHELGTEIVGSIAIHVILDYSNLSFISSQSPYAALLRGGDQQRRERGPREAVEFTVYGWSRRPIYMSGRDTWPLTEQLFQRVFASREPFWARAELGERSHEVYFLNDRVGIYALGFPRTSAFGHLISVAELVVLCATAFLLLLLAGLIYGRIAARTPTSGRALLREVRASFYRKLFIAFVGAAVVPVLALALVTREYIARLMQADLEMEASRTAASASRVVEDVGLLELSGTSAPGIVVVDDDIVVWLSRVIAQDVNIFDSTGLVASSERSLFAYGLLPRSTQGDVYRAIVLDGRPSFVARESVGSTEYLVAAAPVRVQNRQAILAVPLTLRQQEIEAQIDELDRRVLLAAVLFIVLGAIIGYSLAERIADPVNRLMRATGRIARGELNVRILATSSDEFRRLVEAFNRMAADLQRQRAELERSHRLAAWADMARQVAHDIKNPLTPIQLNAEHLRRVHADRGQPLGRVLDECVDNILTQVRLLRQIASEFSSFASSPTVKPAPALLRDVISEVVDPYRVGLKGQVSIEQDVPQSLPLVLVDKAVLARALTNIIENALHAMPSGGSLHVGARDVNHGWVELTVTDTGVGMDRAALDRIFEPYFSTRASGTGLGLTIAKRNVELHGGTIAVESERGKGTTVRMTLPTVPAAA
jgi:signal transduction histidine kinase